MKYVAETGLGAMIDIPSFMKSGSAIQKFMGRASRQIDSRAIA
jgi:hypothetical protein